MKQNVTEARKVDKELLEAEKRAMYVTCDWTVMKTITCYNLKDRYYAKYPVALIRSPCWYWKYPLAFPSCVWFSMGN